MLALCDYVTPNESEAEGITGISVNSVDDAKRAAAVFVEMGARAALITLGENGSYFFDGRSGFHEPAISAGPLVETTGAKRLLGVVVICSHEVHSPRMTAGFFIS